MFTRSAQVLAVVSEPLATVVFCLLACAGFIVGNIAFAAPHLAVFPLMAVAVGVMGVERVLRLCKVAKVFARTDHETLAAPLGLR